MSKQPGLKVIEKIVPDDFVEPLGSHPRTIHSTNSFELGLVEGGGFEPPKVKPADLQSAPVGRLGIPPHHSLV